MLEILKEFDQNLFTAIHNGIQNSVFDYLLPVIRNKYTWIPLYLFFIYWCFRSRGRKAYIPVLITVALVALSDQLSAGFIKDLVQRPRPCNTPDLLPYIRNIVDCGSGYSFVSAHASNHFTLAVLFTKLFSERIRGVFISYIFYLWAGLIAFSQIYVGVHFPLDVICGAILGLALGFFGWFLVKEISGVSG
jgi:undecaprenyl-diphosphatase